MRELRSCEFCGSESAGIYEVVPEAVAGVPSRRMVLCDGCRDTLGDVVDPLIEAIPAGPGGGVAAGVESAAPEPEPEPVVESEPATDAELEVESESATDPDRAVESGSASPAATPDSPMESEGASESGRDADSAAGPEPEQQADQTSGSAADDQVGSAADGDAERRVESAAGEEVESAAGDEAEPAPERVERPEGYGKVVRLVENRDAGIARRDLAELAKGAYGMRSSTVDEAIDFAIEHGALTETDDGLRTN